MPDEKKRRGVGCLLAIAIYMPLVIIGFFLALPPEVTEEFEGRNARLFTVATVLFDDGEVSYGSMSLDEVRELPTGIPPSAFMLPETHVRISTHDIHNVYVLEDHGYWQLIEFNYANSYTSRLYRRLVDHLRLASPRGLNCPPRHWFAMNTIKARIASLSSSDNSSFHGAMPLSSNAPFRTTSAKASSELR